MGDRFSGIYGVGWLVGIIFGICLGVGALMLIQVAQPPDRESLFPGVARDAQLAIGFLLTVSGLLGLLLSGAVRVLIAIEKNTRAALPVPELTQKDRDELAAIGATVA